MNKLNKWSRRKVWKRTAPSQKWPQMINNGYEVCFDVNTSLQCYTNKNQWQNCSDTVLHKLIKQTNKTKTKDVLNKQTNKKQKTTTKKRDFHVNAQFAQKNLGSWVHFPWYASPLPSELVDTNCLVSAKVIKGWQKVITSRSLSHHP